MVKAKDLKRHNKYIEVAKKLSMKSKMNHGHGCVLVYRKKIISVGYNDYSFQNIKKFSMHAEANAILSALKMGYGGILCDCKMYVIRIGPNDTLKYSKPCRNCCKYIAKHNISKVFWSVDD